MPSNANERLINYTSKLIPANVSADLTAQLPEMRRKAARYFGTQAMVRAKVNGILAAGAYSSFTHAGYMAAALRMWSLKHRLGGNSQAEIAYVVATWTSRGYNAGVLGRIRDIITGITAP